MSTKALILSIAPYTFALLTAGFRFIIPSEHLHLLKIHKQTQIVNLILQNFIRKASCRKAGEGWDRKGHGAGGQGGKRMSGGNREFWREN